MRHHHSLSHVVLTTLLVIVAVWGAGYLFVKGIEYLRRPITVTVATDEVRTNQPAASTTTIDTVLKNNTSGLIQRVPRTPAKSSGISVVIGGDVMMDRNVRAIGDRNGYASLFDQGLIDLFSKADIAMFNLEGPITTHPSKTLVDGKTTSTLIFTFPTKSLDLLTTAGIDIVSLANNHTDNSMFLGFRETQDWLETVNIGWFGNPWNATTSNMSRRPFTGNNSPLSTLVTANDITVAFVGYHAFQTGVDRVVADIRRVSGPDVFTIVMPHWGEEYVATSSERMKSLARTFVEAGADAVIGAHPHVVMDHEWIESAPVYYSLGNLLFDQYFSAAVMKGLVVELKLERDENGVRLDSLKTYDTRLVRGQGAALEGETVDVQ